MPFYVNFNNWLPQPHLPQILKKDCFGLEGMKEMHNLADSGYDKDGGSINLIII